MHRLYKCNYPYKLLFYSFQKGHIYFLFIDNLFLSQIKYWTFISKIGNKNWVLGSIGRFTPK